jgi:hypothetical protein
MPRSATSSAARSITPRVPNFLWIKVVAVLAALAAVAACSSHAEHTQPDSATVLSRITPEQWQALSKRTIYFGHQSVGENIVEGIRELEAANPQIHINSVSGPKATNAAPALHEFFVGENSNPQSKNDAFLATVGGPLPAAPVLAFKYCYVDIDENTDANALFEHYRQTIDAVRAKHPDATIVHITMPLTTDAPFRNWINTLRGRPNRVTWNGVRSRYNELLRSAYAGREPLFDLARLESTRSDGSEEYTIKDGHKVYALADEWTTDGGHLNAAASKLAAAHFLATLAALPDRRMQ